MHCPKPTSISNPLHILLLTPDSTPPSSLLRLPFFSSSPSSSPIQTAPPNSSSPAPLPTYKINTAYYAASIPIWHESLSSLSAFKTDYTTVDGAGEVVAAVGAWIVTFVRPTNKKELDGIALLLRTTSQIVSHHSDSPTSYSSFQPTPLFLAIALPSPTVSTPALNFTFNDWEDLCQECGNWEYIDGTVSADSGVRNDYGEATGLARLREALEAHEWDAPDNNGALDLDGSLEELGLAENSSDGSGEEPDLGLGLADLEADPLLRLPILAFPSDASHESGVGQEDEGHDQVRKLEAMMAKLLAAKEMGTDLPPNRRKSLAANAVKEIMKA